MQNSAYGAFQIWGNLYFVGTKSVSSHLIDTGDGLILLDTSYPQTVDVMIANIESLGFSLRDLPIQVQMGNHNGDIGIAERYEEKKRTGRNTFIDSTTWNKHLDSCMARYQKMIEEGK